MPSITIDFNALITLVSASALPEEAKAHLLRILPSLSPDLLAELSHIFTAAATEQNRIVQKYEAERRAALSVVSAEVAAVVSEAKETILREAEAFAHKKSNNDLAALERAIDAA